MSADEARLEADGREVERLLGELQTMVGPTAWGRVEMLLQTVTGLYAAGLERLLEHGRSAGADETRLAERVCEDELTSSLLVLHGLHPRPLLERLEGALARARLDVRVLGVDEGGVATLRSGSPLPSCPSSRASFERTLEELVAQCAPEIGQVRLEGPDPAARLVQIDLRRVGGAG